MKKTLKVLLLVALLSTILFALTGCGNKLVATKTTESSDMNGNAIKYDEKIEISFKKDKINKVKMTYTFENKDKAKSYVDQFNAMIQLAKSFGSEVSLPEMKQSGKSASLELNAKAFAEFASEEEAGMSKEDLKKELEAEGYKVK